MPTSRTPRLLNRSLRFLPVACVAAVTAFAGAAEAQVAGGSIALTSLTDQQFSIVDPVSGNSTPYALGDTTGFGPANTNAICWDPFHPSSFYLGGEGFLGRVTITGGLANYSLITNGVSSVSQISLDANGHPIVLDSGTDQVVRVNPSTGAIFPITVGVQPWADEANCGAIDPSTGDIFVGANKALYVVPNGQTTGTLLSSGWTSGTFGFATTVVLDPFSSDLFVSILTADRIVRMDRTTGAITDLIPPHQIQSCNAIAVDENGDLVAGGWQNNVYRIPNAGGNATFLGQVSNQGVLATAVSVVAIQCAGSAVPYGAGCPGTGGIAPTLALQGCPVSEQTVTLEVSNGVGGATAHLLFGLVQGSVPVGPNCSLLVTPLLPAVIALPLGGTPGVAGAGSFSFPAVIPAGTPTVSFTMQAWVVDSASFVGAVGTNGVAVTIP